MVTNNTKSSEGHGFYSFISHNIQETVPERLLETFDVIERRKKSRIFLKLNLFFFFSI